MSRTIHQTITLKGAAPEELFHIFMDAKKHGELIGAKVVMSRKTGGRFIAFTMITAPNGFDHTAGGQTCDL